MMLPMLTPGGPHFAKSGGHPDKHPEPLETLYEQEEEQVALPKLTSIITSAEKQNGRVLFVIDNYVHLPNGTKHWHWCIRRRYSQFYALWNALKEIGVLFPKMPRKITFGLNIDRRRKGLQRFVSAVAQATPYMVHYGEEVEHITAHVCAFFELRKSMQKLFVTPPDENQGGQEGEFGKKAPPSSSMNGMATGNSAAPYFAAQHSRKASEGLVPIKNDLHKGVVWFDHFWTVPAPSTNSLAGLHSTQTTSTSGVVVSYSKVQQSAARTAQLKEVLENAMHHVINCEPFNVTVVYNVHDKMLDATARFQADLRQPSQSHVMPTPQEQLFCEGACTPVSLPPTPHGR
jgi:hypothetical protein